MQHERLSVPCIRAHHDFVREHCCSNAVKQGARGLNVADTIACFTSPVPDRACATASRRLFTSVEPLPPARVAGASMRGMRRCGPPPPPVLGPAHLLSSPPLAICLLLATFSFRPAFPATVHALFDSPDLISIATHTHSPTTSYHSLHCTLSRQTKKTGGGSSLGKVALLLCSGETLERQF